MEVQIRIAESAEDRGRCYPVLRELRPELRQETFESTIQYLMSGGYHLVMLVTEDGVGAVAGYRICDHLARGRFLYVDDLVTAMNMRRRGYSRMLVQWLQSQARTMGCHSLHLDSGVQRADAHRFYESLQMSFTSRHYSLQLDSE